MEGIGIVLSMSMGVVGHFVDLVLFWKFLHVWFCSTKSSISLGVKRKIKGCIILE
jgi:hypothetical protein